MSDKGIDMDMRAALARAGLRPVDFVRLVALFSDQEPDSAKPDKGTVSRWCNNRHAPPATAIAVCELFRLLPPILRGIVLLHIGLNEDESKRIAIEHHATAEKFAAEHGDSS